MRKLKLTNNAGLKLAAFAFSVLLWFIVVNMDDPVIKATYTDVDVTVTNPEIVTNQGKVYQVLDETKTTVVVSAKRSIIAKITKSDITATADLRSMDVNTYLVPITVSINNFLGRYQSAEATPSNIRIKIEDKTKNTFPLTVAVTGTPRDGYVVGEAYASPEKVSVGGAESLIQKIDKAVARVNVTGMYEDTTIPGELILYDVNGNPIDQGQLSNNLGEGGVSVTIHMFETKSVPIQLSVSGKPKEGYVFSHLKTEPDSVVLQGRKEALDAITQITVPPSALDISGLSEKDERTLDITPFLPQNTSLSDQSSANVVVTIFVEEEGTKTLDLPVESIKVVGLDESLRLDYGGNEEVSLVFTGKEEDLEKFDISNRVSIDLSSMKKAGAYDVVLNVDLPEGIVLQSEPKLTIKLEEKKPE